jgi:integrase
MPVKWFTTQYPNIRYYEHGTRRTRNGQPDKYYAIRYYVNGKRKEEGIGWSTEGWNAEKAYTLLGEIRSAIRTGEGPQSLSEKREREAHAKAASEAEKSKVRLWGITLEEFFKTVYIPQAKKDKRSWLTDEQRIVKEINPALGKFPLPALRKEDIQKFVDSLTAAGYAPETVKQYMGIVRHAYNIASTTIIDGIPLFIGNNPASIPAIKLPEIHSDRERYLTATEAEMIIDAAGKLRSPDLLDCIVLSLNTGLRLGELTRLRWLNVDLIGQFVNVPHEAKRKPGGKVPLNDASLAVFQRRQKDHAQKLGDKVFPGIAGAVERKNLSKMFHGIADALGINDGITDRLHRIVFHSLRHTFASWLALGGTDIYRINKLMRHKSIAMTMRYAHLIPDATRDAVYNLRPPAPNSKT